MIGRLDTKLGLCLFCKGKKTDPKNRKRICKRCFGSGTCDYCINCNVPLPCPGSEDCFDQSYCALTEKKE